MTDFQAPAFSMFMDTFVKALIPFPQTFSVVSSRLMLQGIYKDLFLLWIFFCCLFPAGSLKQKQHVNLPFGCLAEPLDKKGKYCVEVSYSGQLLIRMWQSSPGKSLAFLISLTRD